MDIDTTSGRGWWAQAKAVSVVPFAPGHESICRRYGDPDAPDVTYVIDDFECTVISRMGFPGGDRLIRVDDYVKWMDECGSATLYD